MLSCDDILSTDRLRETDRIHPKFNGVYPAGLDGSHCIQQNSMIYSCTVACHDTPTPPGQKFRRGCVMGVKDLYVGNPMATVISAEDVNLVRQILSQAAMTKGNKHSEGLQKRPHFPIDRQNPKTPFPFTGTVSLAAADLVDEKVDAKQSGGLEIRVRMHHRYNLLTDSAVDGPCKARRTTNDDEEAKSAFIERLIGKRDGGVGTMSWFSKKLTITLIELGFALIMWSVRRPILKKNGCVLVKSSRKIKIKK